MAIAVLQLVTQSVLFDTQTFTLPGSVTSGSALAILFSSFQGVGLASVDDGTNTWARAIAIDDGGSNQVEIWRALNVAAGSTTVTVNLPGSGAAITGVLIEISDVTAADQTASASSPSTTNVVSGTTPTTTNSAAILLAAMTHDGSNPSITPAGGWSELFEQEDNNNRQCGSFVYQIVSATGAYDHTWTIGSAVNGIGVIAALSVGGGGGTPNPWYYYAQM